MVRPVLKVSRSAAPCRHHPTDQSRVNNASFPLILFNRTEPIFRQYSLCKITNIDKCCDVIARKHRIYSFVSGGDQFNVTLISAHARELLCKPRIAYTLMTMNMRWHLLNNKWSKHVESISIGRRFIALFQCI